MPRRVVTGRTLYEDPRLTLSTAAITVRGYWMPFGLPRNLRITEISRVAQHARDDEAFPTWPRWGRGAQHAWFPLDNSRSRREIALSLWTADEHCVVVTPSNPARLSTLLVELGLPVELLPATED